MSRRVAINPSRNLKFRVRGKTGWSMPMFNASVLIFNQYSYLDLSSFGWPISIQQSRQGINTALCITKWNFGDWSIVDTDSFLEKTLFNMQIAQWEVHREGLQLLCKSTGFISCMHRLSQSQTCLLEMILTYYILEQTVCWKFSSSIVLGRVGEGMLNQ